MIPRVLLRGKRMSSTRLVLWSFPNHVDHRHRTAAFLAKGVDSAAVTAVDRDATVAADTLLIRSFFLSPLLLSMQSHVQFPSGLHPDASTMTVLRTEERDV